MRNVPRALNGPSGWYHQIIEIIRRHPLTFGLSVLAISVMAALIVSLKLTLELTRERDNLLVAKKALQKEVNTSAEVVQLLTGIFQAADPNLAQGKTINTQKLVDVATEQTQKRLNQRPEVKARLLRALGYVQQSLGSYDEGLALLEQAQLLDNSKDPYDIAQLANGYRQVRKMNDAGNWLESIVDKQADTPFKQAEVDRIIAEYYRENGSPKKAFKYYQSAYHYWKSAESPISKGHIQAQMNMALVYQDLAEFEKALPHAISAEQKALQLFDEQHPFYIVIQNLLSKLYLSMGQVKNSVDKAKRAYHLAQEVYDVNNLYYSEIVNALSHIYHARGQYLQALDILDFENAKSIENAMVKGFFLSNAAAMNVNLGRFSDALQSIEKSNDLLVPLYQGNIAFLHTNYIFGGMAWGFSGDVDRGLKLLEEGRQLAQKYWGADAVPAVAFDLAEAKVLIAHNRLTGLEPKILAAKAVFEKNIPKGHEGLLTVYEIAIDYYLASERWQKAREIADLAIATAELAWDEQAVARSLLDMKLAQALWHLGERDFARKMILDNGEALKSVVGQQSYYYNRINQLTALVTNEPVGAE